MNIRITPHPLVRILNWIWILHKKWRTFQSFQFHNENLYFVCQTIDAITFFANQKSIATIANVRCGLCNFLQGNHYEGSMNLIFWEISICYLIPKISHFTRFKSCNIFHIHIAFNEMLRVHIPLWYTANLPQNIVYDLI